MIRFVLIIVGVGIVALAGGFIYLGAAPPRPHMQEVHVTLPNDRFGTN